MQKVTRINSIKRKTKETDISITLNLDGSGKAKINSGIGFFDHMLELFCVHGDFDMELECAGDIKVDGHHSMEDIGIVLGKLINKSLGEKVGIARYADVTVPMDEALIKVVLDISGRPHLSYNVGYSEKTGEFDTALVEEFFHALSSHGLLTLHIIKLDGKNNHHIAEAVFKAFARALSDAVKIVSNKIPSSKGMLE